MGRTELDEIEAAIPASYFAGLPVVERVKRLADDWRHAINVNKALQAEHDQLTEARDKALELGIVLQGCLVDCMKGRMDAQVSIIAVNTAKELGKLAEQAWGKS